MLVYTTASGSTSRVPTGPQCYLCLYTVMVAFRALGWDSCMAQIKSNPDFKRVFMKARGYNVNKQEALQLKPFTESEIEVVQVRGRRVESHHYLLTENDVEFGWGKEGKQVLESDNAFADFYDEIGQPVRGILVQADQMDLLPTKLPVPPKPLSKVITFYEEYFLKKDCDCTEMSFEFSL